MRKLANNELNRLSTEQFKQAQKTPLIVVLDNIRSLNNIGSIFRTADAFLIEKVYLCGITATPPHKDIHKTALGATESVEWEYKENTLDVLSRLKNDRVHIIAIEQVKNANELQNFHLKRNTTYALIFGNEVKGIDQNVISQSDNVIEIPQFGTKHSLNISVSVGVVIWDFWTKFQKICQ